MLAAVAPAQAQAGGNRAAAEALFSEGRVLMARKRFSEACPKFEASQQLDPGLGTLLNLADCYEHQGKLASAWAEYREALPLARASGSKVRQDLATERAAALESRLSTMTIRILGGGQDSAALEVRRDGVHVQPAELGSAIPVDPGKHTVEASAPGKQKWSSTYQISADSTKLAVDVPTLASEGGSEAAPKPAAVAPGERKSTSLAATAPSGATQRTVAVVVGAAGVIGLGLGTVFGLQARSTWADAKSHCPHYPYGCDTEGVDLHASSNSKAAVSTIAFIAGGAALAVGAVLWFTAGSAKQASVAVGVGPAAAFIRGNL